MIKRTKISCPTIRRHPNCVNDYKHLLTNCNNIFIVCAFCIVCCFESYLVICQILFGRGCGYCVAPRILLVLRYILVVFAGLAMQSAFRVQLKRSQVYIRVPTTGEFCRHPTGTQIFHLLRCGLWCDF